MIGVNGLEEKGINLQIAVKLKDSLEKQGFSVIMTREEDKGLYEEDSRNQKAQDMQCRQMRKRIFWNFMIRTVWT